MKKAKPSKPSIRAAPALEPRLSVPPLLTGGVICEREARLSGASPGLTAEAVFTLALLENTRYDAMIGVRARRAGTIRSRRLRASTRNVARKRYSRLSPNIPPGEKKPWLLR